MLTNISFKNSRKQTLRGILHEPKKYDTAILFLHGFPSNIEGFTTTRLSKTIEKTNYLFMAFNFSHTLNSDGKFEEKLLSNELKDIKAAIDFLESNYKYTQLVVVGHSTGAINIALYAHKDKRIDKIVLIASSGELKHAVQYEFTPLQVREFWMKGYATYNRPGKWYHKKRIKKAYYDEFFTLDILGSLHKFKGPVLIIHPEKDQHIPITDARDLFTAATKPKKLV
ncbi:TPA: alpha/beta hydrolase, partial [Candidatus Woesearchaeota archaeon]|nr:alpha/beta hydrolase [Candidatus Woesearchaeota archaeon]